MQVSLISYTTGAEALVTQLAKDSVGPEDIIAFCARVSSDNQTNPDIAGLLKYCAKHGHWSVFEMADATFEITTSLDIAAQLLRHKSFNFQQFSARYQHVTPNFEIGQARRQDLKNRQNSIDDLDEEVQRWFIEKQQDINAVSHLYYRQAIEKGIAKECARKLLPVSTQTRLYMKGSFRSWIHYINLRTGNGTQLEHQEIANEIKRIFIAKWPIIGAALG